MKLKTNWYLKMWTGRYNKMVENKNGVRLGDGVADELKQAANQELSDIGKMLIGIISKFVKEKIQHILVE